MINNLNIVARQYDNKYDVYYVARKDESLNFPSDSSIVKAISPNAYSYTVSSKPMPVVMEIKGTLKSFVPNNYGYLSKVAKHLVSLNEQSNQSATEENLVYTYDLKNAPITGSLKGSIYNNGNIIQTFTVDLDSYSLNIEDVEGLGSSAIKVISGIYQIKDGNPDLNWDNNLVELTWNNNPTNSRIKVDYKYESNKTTSILTKNFPVTDGYDFVTLYGNTTIDTKYVKIKPTFKCKFGENFTNVAGRFFYTRCKSFQSLCSSKSGAYVPATTVCSQKLF